MLRTFIYLIGINFLFFISVILFSKRYIWSLEHLPRTEYLLVLGAGINLNDYPSKILADRMVTAAEYAHTRKPKIIILSGTKRDEMYDETLSMQDFLFQCGINIKALHLDPNGFSTLQSCINFKGTFGNQEVTIVSQRFHLYRSIILSRLIGLRSYGFAANTYHFKTSKIFFWYMREFVAVPYNLIKIFLYFMQILANKIIS